MKKELVNWVMFVVKWICIGISGVHSNEVVNAIVRIPPWYTMHIGKCLF